MSLVLQLKSRDNLFVQTQTINVKKEKTDTLELESFLLLNLNYPYHRATGNHCLKKQAKP